MVRFLSLEIAGLIIWDSFPCFCGCVFFSFASWNSKGAILKWMFGDFQPFPMYSLFQDGFTVVEFYLESDELMMESV